MARSELIPARSILRNEVLGALMRTAPLETQDLYALISARLQLDTAALAVRSRDRSGERSKFEHEVRWALEELKRAGIITNAATSRQNSYAITDPVRAAALLADVPAKEPDTGREHTRIQRVLLELGMALGHRVWVASNDRSATVGGVSLGALSEKSLPLSFFAPGLQRTVELIDVLWLDQHRRITTAFEVEATTAIYSGLLRMSDLACVQPVAMYLVAPSDRRDKVIQQLTRPTFERLPVPLRTGCGYISFDALHRPLAAQQPALFAEYV